MEEEADVDTHIMCKIFTWQFDDDPDTMDNMAKEIEDFINKDKQIVRLKLTGDKHVTCLILYKERKDKQK